MNTGEISFPHLGLYLSNVPRGFTVFGFFIALYAVVIVCGMFLGGCIAAHCAKKEGHDKDLIWDFFVVAIVCSVIGARIYYVAFEWEHYKNDLLSILNLRQGGLAIYGGVIAAFLTIVVYCRVKKLNPWMLADYCMVGMILGQAIGRWGNFFNREVFGEYTDNFLAMRLPIADVRARDITDALASHIGAGENFIQVHRTFLYESLWNLLIFGGLLFWRSRRKFHGEVALFYLGGYGLGRFFIEGIRTDTLFWPGTTVAVSQVLAAILFVGSVAADITIRLLIRSGKIRPELYPGRVQSGTADPAADPKEGTGEEPKAESK